MIFKHVTVHTSEGGPRAAFAVHLRGVDGDALSLLTLEEAETLAADLTAKVEEIRELRAGPLVVVNVQSYGAYTYRDPQGDLTVGDVVEVPFGPKNELKVGKVQKLGRGSYMGSVKDVAARLVREELAA